MGEKYLTWAEMEKQYPNEWVLIDRPKLRRKSQEVLGGYVKFHSSDRSEFDRRIFDFPEIVTGAILYTGKPVVDEDEVIIPETAER
jgi:hypothetical protein